MDLPSNVYRQADQVIQCSELWADRQSAAEYQAQLRWRLHSDFAALEKPSSTRQYFVSGIINLPGDSVFVDSGAFDGDTIAGFLTYVENQFKAIYAFEPDQGNFAKLRARVCAFSPAARDKIFVRNCAVGAVNGPLPFVQGAGAGSHAESGGDAIECVRLDDAVASVPTLMKFDVEGFEPEAILGSRRLIAEHTPSLAICVYYLQDHLWKLPLLVKSINPDYKFYLRAHGQIWETICYAVEPNSV